MMEPIFSFLPAYFSIIFLAKGKISKSMFLSHIGPKKFLADWPISLQDFKSNIYILFIWFILFISRDISLEQSEGTVYLLHVGIRNEEFIEKYWNGCGQKWLWPPWSQGEWMNEWVN